MPGPGESLLQKQYRNLRLAYLRHVRRWLSDDAVALVTRAKRKALRLAGVPETVSILPGLPAGTIEIGGLVYTTIFNVGDPRKNPSEILSAYLLAFRDRPDATLVIKLVTNPARENHEVGVLRGHYDRLGLRHRCKVVVITEYLSDDDLTNLNRATTYYVNHSFGEGACLPLQRALAGGRPALAPDHSAMADFVDEGVAFVARSHPEPTHWPHDPEARAETYRFRPIWADLHRNFIESAAVAERDRVRYDAMAATARTRMREYAGRDVVRDALIRLLDRIPAREPGALDWAS